jgi:mono/diheme cytochrome c family protein
MSSPIRAEGVDMAVMRNLARRAAGAATLMFSLATGASGAFAAGDAVKGKETYLAVGCFECHGRSGQGGRLNYAAPPLAQLQLPAEALAAFLREAKGDMPPYVESQLSDADAADIHAFLQTLQGPVDPKTIPLLAR